MLAAIDEVQAELQDMQRKLNVLRLSMEGIAAECDDGAAGMLKEGTTRLENVTNILDDVNDCLTRAHNHLDYPHRI